MSDNPEKHPNDTMTASFTMKVVQSGEDEFDVDGEYSVADDISIDLIVKFLNSMVEDLVQERESELTTVH